MAIAYKAIPLAEVCYIFEVTHWLALGILPEMSYDDNGHEARLSSDEHDDHFEPIFDDTVFLDEDEVSEFLPGIKASEYFDAQSESFGGSPEEIVAQANDFFDRVVTNTAPEDRASLVEHRDSELNRAEIVRWLRDIKRPVERRIDQARARTFLALSEGTLKAKGYILKIDGEGEFQHCESINIPAESWSWETINWESASTLVDGNEVKGAYVETDNMLSLFSLSDVAGNPLSGRTFGSTFIPDTDTNIATAIARSKGSRGRPKKGNGIVETAVCNEYQRLQRSGELSAKREANIQLMIEWAKSILGEKVARTSVQRWLDNIEASAQK